MTIENSLLRGDKPRKLPAETSGHFVHDDDEVSLLSCIKIINKNDLGTSAISKPIGAGKFGTCYVRCYSHFQVCVKVMPLVQKRTFISEANILSKFAHLNLPYLFGICFDKSLSLILSYHTIGDHTVTLDCLFDCSQVINNITAKVDWVHVLRGLLCGLEHLHLKHRIIHNDLKCDNIVLSGDTVIRSVIIDFGKACDISEGKIYTLSEERKKDYKLYHSHIAPDLRDGVCRQSVMSDVYSFGRILAAVNECKLKDKNLEEITDKCLQYNWNKRPSIGTIKTYI